MSVTFGGVGIVSDSAGAWYGQSRFVSGDVEEEVYERTVPRASGVFEVRSNISRRVHVVDVTYYTTAEQTVVNGLAAIRLAGAYAVLSDTQAGSFGSCRLMSVEYGPKRYGRGQGQNVTVLPARLIFKQVVI